MSQAEAAVRCRNCGAASNGNYCANCGQPLKTGQITLHTIFHEVFHYFTHLDKGFGYTLKQLLQRPGKTQREYLDGKRAAHQKPFSMFFICGTLSGLGYYFINLAYQNIHQRNAAAEADFFRHYFILLQAVMVPLHSFILWVLFRNSKRNYAELLVLTLYTVSVVFLVFVPINAAKLLFPDYENRYVEVAFLLFYTNLTNVRFFSEKAWTVVGKTVVMLAVSYALLQLMNNVVLGWIA